MPDQIGSLDSKTLRFFSPPDGGQGVGLYVRLLNDQVSSISTPTAPASLLAGENTDVDAGAEQVTTDSTPCKQVVIQARLANTGVISVGNATVQPFELAAGQSIAIPIDNVNKVYVKASVVNQAVAWLATP